MLYWCASANDWDIVRDGAEVERPVRQDGTGFSLKPTPRLSLHRSCPLVFCWNPQCGRAGRYGKEPGTSPDLHPTSRDGDRLVAVSISEVAQLAALAASYENLTLNCLLPPKSAGVAFETKGYLHA